MAEDAIIAALNKCWPQAAHQRCQSHALSNLAEAVQKHDTQLGPQMRQDLGGLPAVPEQMKVPVTASAEKSCVAQLAAVALELAAGVRPLTPAEERIAHSPSVASCAAVESALELLSFKGIGRYTAGAIRSFAFNEDAPILDTNVIRVLHRVFFAEGDPKAQKTKLVGIV